MISAAEIQPFADRHGIHLSLMEMKSRSLLNRNAQGEYKFSHKSILEYFLAEEALFNAAFRKELNFDGMDQAKTFFEEMIYEKLTVPLFCRGDLQGEYGLKDGKPKSLANLPVKTLPNITRLTFKGWQPDDDLLALQGLKQLKAVEFVGTSLNAAQTESLQRALPDCKVLIRVLLRSEPLIVPDEDGPEVFQLNTNRRPLEYIQHEYEDQGKVVLDRATGLLWQKGGSPKRLTYKEAQNYVAQLNRQKFAGYTDWRLPTIPELMSLLEPETQSNGLYINPIFEKPKDYSWCWSADKRGRKGESSAESAWYVSFDHGSVGWSYLDDEGYVRCVRS